MARAEKTAALQNPSFGPSRLANYVRRLFRHPQCATRQLRCPGIGDR